MAKNSALQRQLARVRSASTSARRRARDTQNEYVEMGASVLSSFLVGIGEQNGTIPKTIFGLDGVMVLGAVGIVAGNMTGGAMGHALKGAGVGAMNTQAYLRGRAPCTVQQPQALPTSATSAGLQSSVLGDLASSDHLLDVV